MTGPRVLVACECSGVVRDAFLDAGIYAASCDLNPSLTPGPHYQMDVRDVLNQDPFWDLMVAHPPCTHLAVSGARWFRDKPPALTQEAIEFVDFLWSQPIQRICIENPVSVLSSRWKKPTQIIQPFRFGHSVPKRTCLWLKNLPLLVPTGYLCLEKEKSTWLMPSYAKQERSTTYKGVALAMAQQWGTLLSKSWSKNDRD